MPWKIISVIGERWRLVQALFRKEKSFRQCCRVFGVSPKTAYKWKRRFVEGGRKALADRSREPHRQPRRLGQKWIERIRRLRQERPRWGAKKLRARFVREGLRPPSERTIARWLKRLRLVKLQRRRPRRACVRKHRLLTVARRVNQVWTVDFKGWFRAGNGERCEPLTVRDLFSRYGLLARVLPTQQLQLVQAAFTRLFREKGMPEVIRVDNGGPFASSGPAGLSRLSSWWIRLGIRVEFTRPGHPEDNAAHEQFHRVLKRETTHPAAWTRGGQQHRTSVWLRDYNGHRPHESLEQKMPRQFYRKAQRVFPSRLPELRYSKAIRKRKVRSNGEVRWAGRKRFIGEAFVRQTIGLRQLQRGIWAVYFAHLLIGHLHDRDLGAMRPVVYKHRFRTVTKSKL